VLALVVFAVVALVVATVVDRAGHLAHRAARATAEAETLSALAHNVLSGEQAIPALLARLRETFGMDSVSLVRRGRTGTDTVLATATRTALPAPGPAARRSGGAEAVEEVSVGEDALLVLHGRPLPAADLRVLGAFAAHVGAALERERLTEAAAGAEPIAAANQARAALLEAVSHDLREPLSVARASVAELEQQAAPEPPERAGLLATARDALGRLSRLTDDLRDLGRLHTGSITPRLRPTRPAEALAAARASLGADAAAVRESGLDQVPDVLADPALLLRAVTGLLDNALRQTPEGTEVQVTVSTADGRVELRVADRSEWSPVTDRDSVFDPFPAPGEPGGDQRTGVRLPLALARGLTEAMGGTLTPEQTPGGGLTMCLALPAAHTYE